VRNRVSELWYALGVCALATALYAGASWWGGGLPDAGSIVGHWIGVIGFALMLVTEVAYSVRKQVTDARWGPTAAWLRFHVVTGLVGPYLVLLHTAMKLRGLAGVSALITLLVVASGVVGRYLYTAIPRDVEEPNAGAGGPVREMPPARQRLATQRSAVATWRTVHVPLTWVLFATAFIHSVAALYYVTLAR